jgi:hypothetical protein
VAQRVHGRDPTVHPWCLHVLRLLGELLHRSQPRVALPIRGRCLVQRARRAARRPVPDDPYAPERAREHHRLLGAGVCPDPVRRPHRHIFPTGDSGCKAMAISSWRDAEASWPDHGEDLILNPRMSPSRRALRWSSPVTWSRSPEPVRPRSRPTSGARGSGLLRRLKRTDIKAAFVRFRPQRVVQAGREQERIPVREQEERGRLTTPARGTRRRAMSQPGQPTPPDTLGLIPPTPAGPSRQRRTARSSPKSLPGRAEQFHSRSERSVRCKFSSLCSYSSCWGLGWR